MSLLLPDRRLFLASSTAAIAWLSGRPLFAKDQPSDALRIHEAAPLNAETKLDRLAGDWITPTETFYVRSNAKEVPKIDVETFKLKIGGLVEKPIELSLPQLAKLGKQVEQTVTLTCAGNRREEHSQKKLVGGVQWSAGAIGNAKWGGVTLRDVLAAAGVKADARHIWFTSLDEVEQKGKIISFGGSIPLKKASQAEIPVLLATHMNGQPLPPEHGYPLRVVVPGFIGARSVKWLGEITISDRPSPNYFVADSYKIVKTNEPEEMKEAEPLYEYDLNSAICSPGEGAELPSGKVMVSGYALAPGKPTSTIAKVEVRVDDGEWQRAKLENADQPFCWTLWKAEITLPRGKHVLAVRATDSQDRTQPEEAEWNAKGYQYNGWHRVTVAGI